MVSPTSKPTRLSRSSVGDVVPDLSVSAGWERATRKAGNQRSVHHREDGSGSDNAKAGTLAELAETVTATGEDGLQPIADAFFADLLFDLLHSTKFGARGALRFLGGMPARMFSSASMSRWD